jgi:nucleotide-binding universal stress UspA family protein
MININRILCPVDFFPASEKAVHYAAGLAAIYGAKIHLLHAVTPVIPTAYEFPMDTGAITKSMEEASSREMNKLAAKLKARGVKAETDIRIGTIHDVISRAISRVKPDLIAMGTHGRTGIDRWFLGSVTEWLMRHSPVPVLALSAKERLREPAFRRILVTTDFSEGTADALGYAFSIAQENESRVTLLHVVHDVGMDVSSRYRESIIEGVEAKLENFVPDEAWDWCEIRTKVDVGHPYRTIERTLEKEKPDLLVMNIHGKGMLDRALLGSTAERVVRSAKCPVLLIPPIKKAKAARKARLGGRAA